MFQAPVVAATPADPFVRYRRVGTVLAALVLMFAVSEFVTYMLHPRERDFIAFWGAARLTLAGSPAAAYDNAALHAVQSAAVTFSRKSAELPFPYPPAFLLLVLPFGLLSAGPAMAAWATATFLPFIASVRRLFPGSIWLAAGFPPVLANAVIGQNGFVTAALFVGGMLLLPARPFAAGLLLGGLVLKPQLALLLPLALIAAQQWRAIAGVALSSAAILLAGLIVFGATATAAWLEQMPLYASIARDGLVGWHKLASVYAVARQAGAAEQLAFALHFAVAALAAFAVWRVWRSDADPLAKASILAAATALTSPYLFIYDTVILVVPLLWLALRGAHPALVGTLWLLPAFTIAQTFGSDRPLNLMPVLPLALLVLCWRELSPQCRARMNSRARSYS